MTVRRAAWILWALAVVLAAAAVAIYLHDVAASTEDRDRLPLGALPALVATILAFATVGGLVVVRQPRNAVGWLFSVLAVALATAFAASGWADYALITRGGSVAGGELAVWLLSWLYLAPLVTAPTLLFLLFPTGRPQSPRWAVLVWLAGGAAVLAMTGLAFTPGDIAYDPPIENPLGARGAAGDAMQVAATAGQVGVLVVLVVSAAGLVVRLRRARGDERVQLKWFGYAAALVAVAFPVAAAGPSEGLIADLLWLCALLAFMSVPLATGVAILRHRLFDIDVVIRRTLVYAALTATLAAAYLAIVLLAGLTVGESDVAIAISTLVVAALFRPARARIQSAVDRRFYRRRYDAARILEGFGARLRDEVDLDALGTDLRSVVAETVQPAHVSLWLKGGR